MRKLDTSKTAAENLADELRGRDFADVAQASSVPEEAVRAAAAGSSATVSDDLARIARAIGFPVPGYPGEELWMP